MSVACSMSDCFTAFFCLLSILLLGAASIAVRVRPRAHPAWLQVARATDRTGPAPARPVQDQNCGCEESPGTPAYPLGTACGQLGACIRGRFRRCTEGFRGGLDSQRLDAG